jgi:hypothetical protein
LKQAGDDGSDAFGGGEGILVEDEIGAFFIERNAGDGVDLILQLLDDEIFAAEVAGKVLSGVADLEDEAGVEVDGSLAGDDGLILEIRKGGGVRVVADGAVRAGGTLGWVRDGDGEIERRASDRSGRNENLSAGRAIEIEPGSVLRVDARGDAVGERVEVAEDGGDLPVAKLNIAGEIAGLNRGGDVLALSEDVLIAAGDSLRLQIETLIADHEKRAAVGGERQAVLISSDGLDVNKLRQLIDELRALVDEGIRILAAAGGLVDLGVELGDLRGELIDLLDGADNGLIGVLLLRDKRRGGLIEAGGKALGVANDGLAEAEICGVGGKLLKAFEELADEALKPGAGGLVEEGLNLIETGGERVELPLSLCFLIQAELKDVVANTLNVGECHSGAEFKIAEGHRRSFGEIGTSRE